MTHGRFGSVLAAVGKPLSNQHMLALAAVLVAGLAGAISGDSIGYLVGDRYFERTLTKLP